MIIIIIFIVVLIAGLTVQDRQNDYEMGGFVAACIGGMGLFFCLLLIPIHRYHTMAKIAAFKATQETITVARSADNDFEAAAIQLQVIESNKWLAETKYWNETLFDIWIPDEIRDIEFIK